MRYLRHNSCLPHDNTTKKFVAIRINTTYGSIEKLSFQLLIPNNDYYN